MAKGQDQMISGQRGRALPKDNGAKRGGDYGAPGGACNAQTWKAQAAEDQAVVENDVDGGTGDVDVHEGPCLAPAGEETGDGGR